MQGRLVRLSHPRGDDFQLLERWFAPDSPTAAFTGGTSGEYLTAAAIEELVRSGRMRYLLIRRISDGEPVGAVDYQPGAGGLFVIGGGVFDPAMWQQGYAADAFVVLIDYLFRVRNARLLQCTVGSFNKRSLEAVARAGFTCEGILRERMYLDGRWHDSVLWSMLRSEYDALVERDARRAGWRVADLVPDEEKVRARQALADRLRSASVATSLAQFLRTAPAGAEADHRTPVTTVTTGRSPS